MREDRKEQDDRPDLDDDSDLDEPHSNLALTDPEEARNSRLDQQFIDDEQELPLEDGSSSDGEEEAPPVAVRRPGRMNRTGSAQEPHTEAVVVKRFAFCAHVHSVHMTGSIVKRARFLSIQSQ